MNKQLIDRIQKAIEYVEENLYERIEIEDVAKAAFMSQSSFYNIFSSVFGTTIKDYIRKRRLSLSAFDLIFSELSVLDIALKYQYSAYESYSRSFKSLFGISPKKYREKNMFTNVFPRVTLIYNNISGGFQMVNKEMNKELIIKKINTFSSGHILDIDIDHFMQINDKYGHKIGDKVLIEVPERIKKVLTSHQLDTDVVRINGDEFAVVIKNQSKAFAENISEDIINAMAPPFEFDGLSLNATICIGISDFTVDCDDEEVIKTAQDAMIQAKKNGRNQYKIAE